MEFNLDFLKTAGEALSSFGKKDKDDDRFDSEVQDQTSEKDTTEIIKTKTEEKEQKEDTEEDLEKKLKNIEKVIDTFSGSGGEQLQVPKNNLDVKASDNINVKPLDMGSVQAKELITEYLKPSVNSDRVGLLYENLRKLNLI